MSYFERASRVLARQIYFETAPGLRTRGTRALARTVPVGRLAFFLWVSDRASFPTDHGLSSLVLKSEIVTPHLV
jgi:hypothetical protein